ncbi:MAG: hypothetical protein KC589_03640, partial [Nanoarchaeota archaeon]|nr:hypothetical protein [Nanoarchaeota archaeon]
NLNNGFDERNMAYIVISDGSKVSNVKMSVNDRIFNKNLEIPLNKENFEIDLNEFLENISKEDKIEVSKLPRWNPLIKVEIKQYEQNNTLNLINITLINNTKESQNYESTIFNVNLKANLDEFELKPFKYEYEYNGFIEENSTNFLTNNCSVKFNEDSKELITTHYKKFSSKKINPKINLNDLDSNEELAFEFFKLSDFNEKRRIFSKLLKIYENYINFYKSKTPEPNNKNYNKYLQKAEDFKKLYLRIKEAINLIISDKDVEKAFDLMQKSFFETNKNNYSGWRLFQIVFIILTIRDIIKKENYDITELLHVDTGGGKSEAYFGIVIFNLFYDRLKGKKFGVTGFTKFPLRMLSIQQLQRIANLFIFAEEIRKNQNIIGDPFALGYFVGNSDEFPKSNYILVKKIKDGKEFKGKIINSCPLCKKEVILKYKEKDETILHYCKNCDKEYYFYFSDEEIYRKLPSFIISTVDKFGSIGFNRRFRSLIGGKLEMCPKGHGYISSGDCCNALNDSCKSEGIKLNYDFDTGPSLMIQDEMHLIREGFGTIDSHFESLIETMKKSFSGTGFKNIAMTATVSGASYQIKQLYNKKTRTFPTISPFEKGEFDFFFEKLNDIIHRNYIGLRPNVRENRYAIRKTFRLISEFIDLVEKDKDSYSKHLNIDMEILNKILTNYKSYLSYHGKKDDIQNMNYYMIHQKDELNLLNNNNGISLKSITLTGESSIDKIRDTINYINSKDTLNSNEIDVVFATNIVSHGVDIEKWNIMCFQGVPRSTAEYIQAVSRVGRKHLGLAIIWFYPNRIRDLSVFENFEEYNEKIEHHVEKVPILRWAKLGFHQTFNSLFCATILNYFSEKYKRPIYNTEQVLEIFRAGNKESENNCNELNMFLKKAYCTSNDSDESNYFLNSIPKEIEKRLNRLFEYRGPEINYFPNALKDSPDVYFSNQMGMRGIQGSLNLVPTNMEEQSFIKSYFKGGNKNE